MRFDLLDIITLVGVLQGIFLIFALRRIRNKNSSANSVLVYLLLIATIMLIGRFWYIRYFDLWFFKWSLLFDGIVFLFGPLLYLYLRRLLISDEKDEGRFKVNYLPFVIFTFFALYLCLGYDTAAYYELFKAGKLDLFFILILGIGIAWNAIFVIRSFKLIGHVKQAGTRQWSFSQQAILFGKYLLIAIGLLLVAWTVAFFNYALFGRSYSYVNYDYVWIMISVTIYVVGYYSLQQPELFRAKMIKIETPSSERIPTTEAEILDQKLTEIMEEKKMFLNPQLTLIEVASALNSSSQNISWILNQVRNTTFYDYINQLRVAEFVKRVEDNQHKNLTILALAMEVGFNSKSTFNKAFKNFMKDTPSNFIKSLKVA